jgi:hypothetical protein
MYLNFYSGGKFKCITKTKGVTEIENVALSFIGCIHPESIIKFLNYDDQNHDGLLERYLYIYKIRFLVTTFNVEFKFMQDLRNNSYDFNILKGI